MTVKYPQVPEDLSGLSDDQLVSLRDDLTKQIRLVTDGSVVLSSAEDKDALENATRGLLSVKGEIAGRKDAAKADADRLALAAAALEDDPEDDDPEEDEDDEDDEEVEAEAETPAPVEVATTSSATTLVVKETVTTKPQPGVGAKDEPEVSLRPAQISAFDGAPGKRTGEAFTDWLELSESMIERYRTIGSNDGLVPVGAIKAQYPAERSLEGLSPMELAVKLSGGAWSMERNEELTAAMCAPCTPYYGMSCANTTRRPVFGSLPQFPAPRGCVSIPTSPTLASVTGGYGFWDRADDLDVANQTKEACLTVTCPTMTDYYFYGVYRCLTVQNFMEMTWPEVVEAYLNRLAARTMRAAEIQLLDLMAANVNRITAPGIFTSATVALSTQLLQYLAGAQERERWDTAEDGMEMWAPRWLAYYLRIDMMRRRRTDGGVPRMPSMSDVNNLFSDLGFNVHWFIDTPTWGVTAPVQGTGNPVQLVAPPTSVKVLVAPRGKFALIDRGELRIGVQGNNVVRDLDTLRKNQFSMFFETFEGIVDTDSCPADLITIPTCFSGIQHADQSVDCYGFADAVS